MRFPIRHIFTVFLILTGACLFTAGLLIGLHFDKFQNQPIDWSQKDSSYKFINPLLFCTDQNLTSKGVNDLQKSAESYIQSEKDKGELTDASFYFRDLNGGPWALVNPDFRSFPASLLKVPLAISVYKYAEKDPAFLSKKVILKPFTDVDQTEYFQPREKLQAGETYTPEDFVRYMLEDSDNAGLIALNVLLGSKQVESAYEDLGVPPPFDPKGYTIDAKTYSSFFRILYNGTYLSQEDSEHILYLLSQSAFKDGIVAGLPSDVVTAHKFGEYSNADGLVQLNDCGIVYKPRQPYLICAMTKGTDFKKLSEIISHLSSITYENLSNH
jgi:beta-lactamase class A